jgi:hypothetical protein
VLTEPPIVSRNRSEGGADPVRNCLSSPFHLERDLVDVQSQAIWIPVDDLSREIENVDSTPRLVEQSSKVTQPLPVVHSKEPTSDTENPDSTVEVTNPEDRFQAAALQGLS